MSKKEVAKKQNQEVADASLLDQFNSVESETTAKDKLIPKIVLVHSMSELAKSKDAQEGDFIETLGGKKLGDVDHPLDFVPIWVQKVWIESVNDEFSKVVPITAANEDLPYEDKGGVTRDRCTNFVVALVSDLDQGFVKPYVIPFRRAREYTSAKKVMTQMEELNVGARRAKYVGSVMELKTKVARRADGKEWLIWDAAEKRATSVDELKLILPLFKEASTGLKKAVDNSDLKQDAPSVSEAGY